MTVFEMANMLLHDEEFYRGGIPTNERELLDAVGFEYTVKSGAIQCVGEDAAKLYEALVNIIELDKKYSK